MIIDHITLTVSDFTTSKKFYSAALAPLGIAIVTEFEQVAGFGKEGKGELWLTTSPKPHAPLHIAFAASTRDEVQRFYEAALRAGGADNGAPGVRAIYHPNYYAAYITAPEGHNIEAVCHSAS